MLHVLKSAQGGYQFLAVLVTLGMSVVGGLITGNIFYSLIGYGVVSF